MGSVATALRPPSADEQTFATGAAWHHNLTTVDVDALEAVYDWLDIGAEPPGELGRGLDAVKVTIYRELLTRGGRALFTGDNLVAVDVAEVNAGLTPRCESPVCSRDHDAAGRHRTAAHV